MQYQAKAPGLDLPHSWAVWPMNIKITYEFCEATNIEYSYKVMKFVF